MTNSIHQSHNVDGAFTPNDAETSNAARNPYFRGPVLLVDDVVDSRWTLTVCAWLLRSIGSGDVLPLALSLKDPGQDQEE